MGSKFDIDKVASDWEPVIVTLRGQDWELGRTMMQLLEALDAYRGIDEKDEVKLGLRMVVPCLKALCPELGMVIDEYPLTPPEEIALIAPLKEVLGRTGRFRTLSE